MLWAQEPVPTPPPPSAPEARIQQLLAPVALFPDPVLAEVLAAATEPAGLGSAERLALVNDCDTLARAGSGQGANPSLMALTAYPDVLVEMSQNPGWTRDLGDVYYYQPDAVMAAIQTLRHDAEAAGTLAGNGWQRVTQDSDGTVRIEAAAGTAMAVPVYENPWVMYGHAVSPMFFMTPSVSGRRLALPRCIGVATAAGVDQAEADFELDFGGGGVEYLHHPYRPAPPRSSYGNGAGAPPRLQPSPTPPRESGRFEPAPRASAPAPRTAPPPTEHYAPPPPPVEHFSSPSPPPPAAAPAAGRIH